MKLHEFYKIPSEFCVLFDLMPVEDVKEFYTEAKHQGEEDMILFYLRKRHFSAAMNAVEWIKTKNPKKWQEYYYQFTDLENNE